MKKIIVVIGVLIMVGAGGTIGALYAQIWNPAWNPFRPAPEIVLAEMVVKMKGLTTWHTEGNFEAEVKNDEMFNISLKTSTDTDQTDSENPKSKGDLDIRFSTEGMEISTGIEFIGIGLTAYWKITTIPALPFLEQMSGLFAEIKNQWIKIDQESLKEMLGEEYQPLPKEKEKELMKKLTDLLKGRKFYDVKEELPDEKVGEQMAYRYLVSLDKEEVKKLVPEMFEIIIKYTSEEMKQSISEEEKEESLEEILQAVDRFFEEVGEITVETWIGQKDKYLYKVKFEKEIDLSNMFEEEKFEAPLPVSVPKGGILFSMEINLSKFNQPVVIEAPKEFKTLEEITQSLMQYFIMPGIPMEPEFLEIPEI